MLTTGPDTTAASAERFADLVTSSRAGDRFHYVWAAVQSLKLLDRQSRLDSVWIEAAAGDSVPGAEIIDIAEYYGAGPGAIDQVVVRQLKYSTKRANRALGLAELGPTLRKFAQVDSRRNSALRLPSGATARYIITSNRPVGITLLDAIEKIISGAPTTPSSNAGKLLTRLELSQGQAANLFKRIQFDGAGSDLAALRTELGLLAAGLSGDTHSMVPAVLIEQVSRRASGEIKGPIDVAAVAMAFGATVEDLTPAPNLIAAAPPAVPREKYRDLAELVISNHAPTILSAVGGAGKTTFAASLPSLLKDRAIVIVYDCFGNGSYRAPDKPRHRHRDGLVQIASELAAQALCAPIIPSASNPVAELLKLFVRRLQEAQRRAASLVPNTELVVVIDAADNAVLASDARGDHAFVRDLLRLDPIEGVHLVVTARPHRVALLEPPPNSVRLELPEFSLDETAKMLRSAFSEASDSDVEEFHRRTSANPRIQRLALSESVSLRGCLASLAGITPTGADPVDQLLGRQLDEILDAAGHDRDSLEFAGQLLATLRPRIPIEVLASLTGRSSALIRSFVSDLGRGLLVEDDAVQFLDEPTETFFRRRYQLSPANADGVISQLTELSRSSSYAAAALPQVLWEAGRYDALTELALSEEGLPDSGEVERRQIAQLRSSFALRAAIRLGKPAAVVELAMIAGAAAASSERRYALLRDEPDLAGEVLDSRTLDEIRAARLFPSDWPGSTIGAEAVMLAMKPERTADALNRLRAAGAAIYARLESPVSAGGKQLEPRHGAQVAFTAALLRNEESAARYLEEWYPDSWIFQQTRLVVATLLSRGEGARVSRLGAAARTAALSLATAAELQRLGAPLTPAHIKRAWRAVRGARVEIDHDEFSLRGDSDAVYRGAAWIAAWAVRSGTASPRQAINLLTKYLPDGPPPRLGDHHGPDNAGLLCAYALQAALRGQELELASLEPPLDRYDRSTREEERARLAAVLPWLREWARWALGQSTAESTLTVLDTYPTSRASYRDPVLLRRIAGPMAAQFARSSRSSRVIHQFQQILESANAHSGLFVATDMIASLQGDGRYIDAAYSSAVAAATSAEMEQQSSDQMADDLVRVARSLYAFDPAEARAYFQRAVTIVSRIGDDAWQRWESILSLARGAILDDQQEAFLLAAHLAHSAERLEPYMYSGFDTAKLVDALQRITGPRTFAILSQWRDRRFGDFGLLVGSLRSQRDGVLADDPALSIVLSPFSDGSRIGDDLTAIEAKGELTDARFSAAQQLVWAQGEELTSADVGAALADRYRLPPRQPTPSSARPSSTFDDPDYETKQALKHETLRASLREMKLDTREGMAAASSAIREHTFGSDMSALTEEIARRPKNTWAAILAAVAADDSISSLQRGDILRRARDLQSPSQAFQAALRDLGWNYLERHASDLTSGFSLGIDLDSLASVLQTDAQSVLLKALSLTDADIAVASADSCYRLAGAVARLLTPSDAARALNNALAALDSALEIDAWSVRDVEIPAAQDIDSAVVSMVWCALADPRAGIRWRAIHAMRFLIVYGIDDAINALANVVAEGPGRGYTDTRFPFYGMHAVEGFLVAAERAAIEDPHRLAHLMPSIATLRASYPNHVRIQSICREIAVRCGDETLARASEIARQPTEDVPPFKRRNAPKPYGRHAAKADFSFHFDFEEYAIAPLSESFSVEHQEVVHMMSGLILDEWAYRGTAELASDPRRAAGAYASEETYFYKHDFPSAEDLNYYLSYHALLTVAGRLLRRNTRYRDPQDGADAFDEWFRRFDIARTDRRWLSDARRPVPVDVVRRQRGYGDGWLWEVEADDFVNGFLGEDGWITVRSAAHQSEYRTWDNTFVTSALVTAETGPALLRALQWAPSFNDHCLPSGDDVESSIDARAFQLRGWIDSPDSASGADSRDDFARDVHFPGPSPSEWIRDLVGLTAVADGLAWRDTHGAEVAVSRIWSQKDRAREARGPDGRRLQVSPKLLDSVTKRTGMALVLEVRIDRFAEPAARGSAHDNSMGYLDDYVKFFLFTPADGWRDSYGRSITRTTDRSES